MHPATRLEDVAALVADGRPPDWDSVESSVPAEDAAALSELRILSQLLELHSRDSLDVGIRFPRDVNARRTPTFLDEFSTATVASIGTWGKFTLLEEVGRGSFGIVYRAWDPTLEREVALKVIEISGDDPATIDRVLREGRLLARVRHPNVVTVYDAQQIGRQVAISMEFIRGRMLSDVVRRQAPFAPHEAALVGIELCRALAAVHGAGLLHRDIKARNVMREAGGRIVLMDFGAGRDLETADRRPPELAGTPIYMAPELLDGGRATVQSDLYSIGVLLFYLVTGRYPVEGASTAQIRTSHQHGRRKLIRDLRPDAPVEFIACVDRLLETDPARRLQTAGEAEAALAHALARKTPSPARLRRNVTIAAALAMLIALGTYLAWSRIAGGDPIVQSLAVLPMLNLSGDPGRDYFVDGMHDQLIAELSRISSLQVTARTSVMGYRNTDKALPQIAGELGVEALVETSMAIDGPQLRVNAALFVVRGSDQSRLWGKTYEKESVRNAFVLQATMARDIAAAIRAVLTPEEQRDLAETYIASEAAQESYLRGRSLMHVGDRKRMPDACALFEQAVASDSRYALAWASLSRCRVIQEVQGSLSPAAAEPLVKQAAQQAIDIDPLLPEAHMALADARFKFDWDWHGADESYRQALTLNPSFSLGQGQYARFLAAAGRREEATQHARRGVQSDTRSASVWRTFALMLYYERRYPEALVRADEAARLEPESSGALVVRARILSGLERYDEALSFLNRAWESAKDPAILAEIGRVLAVTDRRAEAEAILARIPSEAGPTDFVHAQDIAFILTALGRTEEALTRLEQAVDERSSRILWLRVDPRVDALRDHPRFKALLGRLGGL